jgi:hypothetical protein
MLFADSRHQRAHCQRNTQTSTTPSILANRDPGKQPSEIEKIQIPSGAQGKRRRILPGCPRLEKFLGFFKS